MLVFSETDYRQSFVCEGEEKDHDDETIQRAQRRSTPATSRTAEVQPPSTRRARSAAEKLRIIQEYDSYPVGSPERGAVLRRAGIYTSQISKWRKQRDLAVLAGLTAQRRGPKAMPRDPLVDEVEQLRKENARLQARLAQAETIIDVQKKVAQVLGSTLPSLPLDER